jgi:hypothetical protein
VQQCATGGCLPFQAATGGPLSVVAIEHAASVVVSQFIVLNHRPQDVRPGKEETDGNGWKRMETNGNKSKQIETNGNKWKQTETNGNKQKQMETELQSV